MYLFVYLSLIIFIISICTINIIYYISLLNVLKNVLKNVNIKYMWGSIELTDRLYLYYLSADMMSAYHSGYVGLWC